MARNRKRKLKSWPFTLLFFIIVFGILIYCFKDIKGSLSKGESAKKVQVLDQIEGYDYSLSENDTKYYKSLFKDLKKNLESEKKDEEKYASVMSQMFIADFFDLNSAINKNDIGGLQFIYSDFKDTFLKLAKNSIYKYVESNMYKDRNQELPIVTNVEVTDISTSNYTSQGGVSDESAYYVSVKITYEKDLGYQTVANLIMVHKDKKLEIVEMK